jgi:dipeptidyl aminopeptidase/acylaminoacyl peptidase
MRLPGAPALSPDGRSAVVAVSRLDFDADDYTSQLWLLDTSGSEPPRQLTYGWRDSAPRISPDGKWVAFTRTAKDRAGSRAGGDKGDYGDKSQLCVMSLAGGEPRKLTDHPLGAGGAEWSPDSTRLAYTSRLPAEGRYGTGKDVYDEKIGADAEAPRRITKLFYRVDDLGFLYDRPQHVFVVPVDGGAPSQVTSGEYDHGDPSWSPDGNLLTFVAARHENAGNDLATDVWVCRPDGTDLRALTPTTHDTGQPMFSPDGSTVVFVGSDVGEDKLAADIRNAGLWSVPAEGGTPTLLLDENISVFGGQISVTADGVLFPAERRGAVDVLLAPYGGGEPTVLVNGERQANGPVAAGGVLAAVVADPNTWGDIYAWDFSGGKASGERRLTDFNAEYREKVQIFPQEELNGTAPDGYPVHGWVVRPPGPGPHPVLLLIHGGPYTQYGWRLFDEAQVYAAAGYAVVMGNPRGSSGYGEPHGRAIMGNVGEISAVDLIALLDAALKSPELDGERVGVLGGSHGGFMTTWLAAHHSDRFKAALSERAVNAIDSFTGSSDIGWCFADSMYGKDPAEQARQSPLTYADKINIPMLIVHSEHDWRCPVEQAQRLFVALKRRGATVEMLLFPGEGHELTRSGLPSHRKLRFEAVIDWWNRWL